MELKKVRTVILMDCFMNISESMSCHGMFPPGYCKCRNSLHEEKLRGQSPWFPNSLPSKTGICLRHSSIRRQIWYLSPTEQGAEQKKFFSFPQLPLPRAGYQLLSLGHLCAFWGHFYEADQWIPIKSNQPERSTNTLKVSHFIK